MSNDTYEYMIIDESGQTIATGTSAKHTIDEADRLVLAHVEEASIIIESSRDKQEPGCWCYTVKTNACDYTVVFK